VDFFVRMAPRMTLDGAWFMPGGDSRMKVMALAGWSGSADDAALVAPSSRICLAKACAFR